MRTIKKRNKKAMKQLKRKKQEKRIKQKKHTAMLIIVVLKECLRAFGVHHYGTIYIPCLLIIP